MQTPYEMTPTTVALCLSPKRLGCQRMRQLCALVREYLLQKLEKRTQGELRVYESTAATYGCLGLCLDLVM